MTVTNNNTTLATAQLPTFVVAITTTSCVLSLLGSLAIIVTYIVWPDLRTTTRRVLNYLSVASFCSVCAILPGVVGAFDDSQNFVATTFGCVVQSAISTFFTTSSFFWTVALVVYLLVTIKTIDHRYAEKLLIYFHIVCWGLPAVLVITALLFKSLGPTQNKTTVGWCWVDMSKTGSVWWMLVTGKAWELLACVTLVILCVLIKRQITKQCRGPQVSEFKGALVAMKKIDKKLLFIALVFVVSRVFDTVRFFLVVFNSPLVWNHILMALQGIGNTSQGVTNFILFCVCTEKIRRRFLESITKKGGNRLKEEVKRLLQNSDSVVYTKGQYV